MAKGDIWYFTSKRDTQVLAAGLAEPVRLFYRLCSRGFSWICPDCSRNRFNTATRAALYTIKPTAGSVDTSSIWPVSSQLDAVGGLTEPVIALATVTTSLLNLSASKRTSVERLRKNIFREGFKDF